jgi:hypothetical protein
MKAQGGHGDQMSVDVVSRHVESCVRHLMEDLDLRSLLALTHRYAPAGQAALDLVMPLLAEPADFRWPLLHDAFPSPRLIIATFTAASATLVRVDPWTEAGIEEAITLVSESRCASPGQLDRLLRMAILQHPSPLQLAAVMQVLGKNRCLARLRRVEAAFGRAQMIG